MTEACTHNCETCGKSCSERTADPKSFLAETNPLSKIERVIGIVSGKGGVGKSLVTGMLAAATRRQGQAVAILDGDITGPSIPKMFGIAEKAQGMDNYMLPAATKTGMTVMSTNMLLENDTDPVVWRGPIIANMVKQFWTDVVWGEVDTMFVDMPPGTGDVPLTVFQSLPLDGIIIVTSPQELVSMIVAKAVKMAELMNIPILGVVENMSYITCPDCDKKISVFGESHVEAICAEFHLPLLGKIPIDPELAAACDKGLVEMFDAPYFDAIAEKIKTNK